MNKKAILCGVSIFTGLLLAGCQSNGSLANYDGGKVTNEEVNDFLVEEKTDATLKVALEKLFSKKIKVDSQEVDRLYNEQDKKSTDTISTLNDSTKQSKKEIEFQLLLEKATEEYLLTDKEALQTFYNGWQSPVKAYELAFSKQDEAEAAVNELRAEGADIAKVAEKYHCTTDTGVKEIPLNTTNKGIEDAVYALKNKGDVSSVVSTPFGFYVMVLEQASSKKSFEESKSQLEEAYLEVNMNSEATQKMLKETLQKNHVKFEDSTVKKLVKEIVG